MNYDSFVTAAIAREAQALVGAYVDHVAQPAERDLYLTFYTGRGKERWVFSADPRTARVHRVERKLANPPTPPNFCMLVRKWIDGARLTAVRQVGFDRVIRWEFTRSDGDRTLIAEVMGKHSNLLLVEEAGLLLGAIKLVPASVSRARQVLPGLPYTPPPGDRLNPLTADREAFLAAVSGTGLPTDVADDEGIARGTPPPVLSPADLVRALSGFGPFAAAEVIARAGSSDPPAVWTAVADLAAATREARFEPTLFRHPGDRTSGDLNPPPSTLNSQPPRGFWSFRSVQMPVDEQVAVPSISGAADQYFGLLERGAREGTQRKELLAGVRKERERLERLSRRLEEDLRRGEEVEQWKIAGELLASNLWRVERGQADVEVPNYYDPEQRPLRIELDPVLTPQENVERLFRRYRKGTDAALQAMEQSGTIAARLADAKEWEARVTDAASEALPALAEQMASAGVLHPRTFAGTAGAFPNPKSKIQNPKSDFPPGIRIRRFMVDGWEVLLGENAPSNDYLTTRVARPDDWWLHVRAAPSSHVVVRTGGHPERVPPAVLQEAARITAAHSEVKHSSYVPVDYVLKKYVRKPRGSAPGLVTHQNEKTFYVEPARPPAAR